MEVTLSAYRPNFNLVAWMRDWLLAIAKLYAFVGE